MNAKELKQRCDAEVRRRTVTIHSDAKPIIRYCSVEEWAIRMARSKPQAAILSMVAKLVK